MSVLRFYACANCEETFTPSLRTNYRCNKCFSHQFCSDKCKKSFQCKSRESRALKLMDDFMHSHRHRIRKFAELISGTSMGLLMKKIFDTSNDGTYIGMSYDISKAEFYQSIDILTKLSQIETGVLDRTTIAKAAEYIDKFNYIIFPTVKMIPNDPKSENYGKIIEYTSDYSNKVAETSEIALLVIRIYSDEGDLVSTMAFNLED